MDSYPPRERSRDNGYGRDEGYGRDGPDSYRRRSPVEHRRNGRGRSRSPLQGDRYQPGRRDDGHPYRREDNYRRRSPPPNMQGSIDRYVPGQDPPPIMTNPMIDPLKMENSVGFSYFAEWWRVEKQIKDDRERQKTGARRPPVKGERESREEREKEREQIQVAYDTYKEKLQAQNSQNFCQMHKHEEWFKERYDPAVRDPLRQRQAEFRRGIYSQWEQDLQGGAFDEFTLEGIYKSESNGAGGIVEKEEGEAATATEVLAVSDLLPAKGGDIRDEAIDQPALLIKTIAPHVSRAKLETFCKEHIGEGEGGFSWLSLSDPNTLKKCHRIGWVMLKPGGDETITLTKEERGDGREEEGENAEDGMDTTEVRAASDKALAEINGKSIPDEERGDFQVHVGIHVPSTQSRKKALWDLFSAPERVERDLELATRLVTKFEQELGEDISGIAKIEERIEDICSRGLLQPAPAETKTAKSLDENGEEEDGEMEEDGALADEEDNEDLLVKKKKLDLLVEYLRRVYNFCFFCVFESDSVHELTRKCPGGHLRRPRASLTSLAKEAARASARGEPFPLKRQESTQEDDVEGGSPVAKKKFQGNGKIQQQLQRAYNWVKTYEDKLFQILEPDSVDLKRLGGRPVEEALKEELVKYVKQEDESKYRCRVPDCTKLFKGESFWKKHVEKRHEEWYSDLKKDLDMINNYVLDPAHVAPSRDAPTNGQPGSNGMQIGTPRGFSLQGMNFGYPGMAPVPPPGVFPAFGNYPVTLPAGVMPFNNGFGGPSAGGPMRRGPGQYGNRTAGPYDRQPRDARNMRWGAGGPPARGGVRPGGAARFPDAIPSQDNVPEAAVHGRTVKSYEDLDAVQSGGTGGNDAGLDY